MNSEVDHVVTLGRSTLESIQALIDELGALSAAYKQKLANIAVLQKESSRKLKVVKMILAGVLALSKLSKHYIYILNLKTLASK